VKIEGEGGEAGGAQQHPGGGQQAGWESVGQTPGNGTDAHEGDRQDHDHRPHLLGGQVLGQFQVEGEGEVVAGEGHEGQPGRQHAQGEGALAQQADVEHWLALAALPEEEQRQEHRRRGEKTQNERRAPARLQPQVQRGEKRQEARRAEPGAGQVQVDPPPDPLTRWLGRDHPHGGQDRDGAHRHVDEEDPVPG